MAKNLLLTVSSPEAKHKVIIIDEADNTTNDVQLLRAFTEESVAIVDLPSPVTYKNKIIEPLHSRCACIDFSTNSKKQTTTCSAQFFKRIQQILDTEGVNFDNKVLVELITLRLA